MQANNPNFRAAGVGSMPGNGATAETEVLPPDLPPYQQPGTLGVQFSRATLQHPAFWFLMGAGASLLVVGAVYWACNRDD